MEHLGGLSHLQLEEKKKEQGEKNGGKDFDFLLSPHCLLLFWIFALFSFRSILFSGRIDQGHLYESSIVTKRGGRNLCSHQAAN